MKTVKNISKGFVQLIFCAIFFTGMFLLLQYFRNKSEHAAKRSNAIVHFQDSTSHYRDAYQREHAHRVVVEADKKTIAALYRALRDSVAKSTGAKPKNIGAIVAAGTTTQQTLIVDTVYVDTVSKTLSFWYEDRWLSASGICELPTSLCSLSYAIRDSFIISSYAKRKNIFTHPATYVDAYSLNPHTRVNTITAFRVATQKPRRWTIGPYAGYGFNGKEFGINAGICLQYSLIRL